MRIKAKNDFGAGHWSNFVKVSTFGTPPEPPVVECSSAGHNTLKLRWSDVISQESLTYSLEMENRNGRCLAYPILTYGIIYRKTIRIIDNQ